MTGVDRRRFIQACLGAGLFSMGSQAREAWAQYHPFSRAQLVHESDGSPVRLDDLERGVDYVFFYPYQATPCFLIDLGRPTSQSVELETEAGTSYRWPGGIGPDRSVVAFSAICAHRLAHPTPSVSFIGYRPDADRFMDKSQHIQERKRVIHCCSENSVYDPAQGCRVLGGPAPQPLAAVALESDETGRLSIHGLYGATQFERFFDTYGPRLELEYGGPEAARRPIEGTAQVMSLDAYTRRRIRC